MIALNSSISVPKMMINTNGEIELPYGQPLSILCVSLPLTAKLLEYKNMCKMRKVLGEAPICYNRHIRMSWSTLSNADFQSIKSTK